MNNEDQDNCKKFLYFSLYLKYQSHCILNISSYSYTLYITKVKQVLHLLNKINVIFYKAVKCGERILHLMNKINVTFLLTPIALRC